MLLLHDEGQREILDMERQILAVEHAEHIDLLYHALHAALELTDTRLLIRIVLNHVLEHLRGDTDLLHEIHLLECSGNNVLLGDCELLLAGIALQLDNHHTIKEYPINLVDVVATEHEHDLLQINRNTGQVLILKVPILYGVRKVDQHVLNLLALRRSTDLVQLVKHEDHGHGLSRTQRVDDLT